MPTYDTTSPEYIQAKQERLEELGRRCTLISTEGTQQYQRSLIMCNGCGGHYNLPGNMLFRRGKGTTYPGCDACNQNEILMRRRSGLIESGKELFLINFRGTQQSHVNIVRCLRCGSEPYEVNGRMLFQRTNPVAGCEPCTHISRVEHGRRLSEYNDIHGSPVAINQDEVNRRLAEKALAVGFPAPALTFFGGTQATDESIATCGHCEQPFTTTGENLLRYDCTYFGCNYCRNTLSSRGTSLVEFVIGFELRQFFPDYDPSCRVIEDVEQRYSRVDVRLSPTLIIEFDGKYWHYSERFNRLETDNRKTQYLQERGFTIIRIREGGIPSVDDCFNVSCDLLNGNYELLKTPINDILEWLVEQELVEDTMELQNYLQQPSLVNFTDAQEYYNTSFAFIE